MAISKKVRFEIFKRDNFTCSYCGAKPPDVTLEIDHVIAKSQGGEDDEENLLTSCFECNRGKSNRGLGASVLSVVDIKAQKEKLKQLKKYDKFLAERRAFQEGQLKTIDDEFSKHWGVRTTDVGKKSIRLFMKKLPIDEIMEAIDITASKGIESDSCFRYFCGVCHNKIKGWGNG